MPNYTLYYFNGRGRAEVCRMIFAAGGVQYNDKRIEFSEWERCRNDFPCMRLPCLEMEGGMKMPEMMSISRFLAREYKFYPTSNMDMFRCDYICDCFYEMFDDYMRYYHWKNGRFRFGNDGMMMGSEMQTQMQTQMQSSGDMNNCNYDNYMQWRYMNSFNRIMPFLEKTLCMKNGGSNFFMGEQMMWCDMLCYCFMENFMMENQSMFSSYPKMMSLYSRVAAHPKICTYLKSRSNTNW